MSIYSSGIVAESFWLSEMKQVVRLLVDGYTWEMIQARSIQNNLFGVSKEYRNYRIYRYLRKRIEGFDKSMYQQMLDADYEVQKLINLVLIAKQYALFYEYLYDVYQEKRLLHDNQVTAHEIEIYLQQKQQQEEQMAHWTDVTLHRLSSRFLTMMLEAGLVTKQTRMYEITPPIYIPDSIQKLIGYEEKCLLEAITGVNV